MPPVDWSHLFIFTVSPIELFIRGSILYICIFILMRILRREPGGVGIADLLMVVLIADAAQNAMAGEYRSVLDGLVLVFTIVFWNFFMDWLTLRSAWVERFTYPQPITLVEKGKRNPSNMRKQFVTEAQLRSILRQHGIRDLSSVEGAFVEGNGQVSVIHSSENETESDKPQHVPGAH
jgi:uncharacterized membrane protein YcaP (DUF421 family)